MAIVGMGTPGSDVLSKEDLTETWPLPSSLDSVALEGRLGEGRMNWLLWILLMALLGC